MQEESIKLSWYREPYVWLVISFPLSAVIAGFFMLWLAIVSYDGLVVDDYYKKGLEINKTLERDQNAEHYKLDAVLQINESTKQFRLILSADPDFLSPEKISVNFLHATRAGHDQMIPMLRQNDLIYQGAAPELIPGNWYIHIEADDWRLVKNLKR